MATLQDIKKLYIQSFPDDSSAVVELFFANKLGLDNCFFIEDNNKLACQLFIINKTMFYLNSDITLPYIVGLGTATESRYKGLASILMKKVLSDTKSPFIALYPFLHSFYEKMGFATVSYDIEDVTKTSPISLSEVQTYYNDYVANLDFFIARDNEDFVWFNKVMEADKINYNGTILGGYTNGEETVISGVEGKKAGTMVRIANLQEALALSKINLPAIKIIDNIIEKNNVIVTVKNGVMMSCDNYEQELDIQRLCLMLFGKCNDNTFNVPKYNGHLLDRY